MRLARDLRPCQSAKGLAEHKGMSGSLNRLLVGALGARGTGFLGRRLCVLRYVGMVSGRTITLVAQYAVSREDAGHARELVIAVARPGTKTWWRNFRTGAPGEVLLQRRWHPVTLEVCSAPGETCPCRAVYRRAFPSVDRLEDLLFVHGALS